MKIFNDNYLEPLEEIAGVTQLKETFDLEHVEHKNVDINDSKIALANYWITFVHKDPKIAYDVFFNFQDRTLFINDLVWATPNNTVFLSILCGIINNAGEHFDYIRITTVGHFGVYPTLRLYYLCPLYGFLPNQELIEELLREAKLKGLVFENAEELFHTDRGLEYWLRFGKPSVMIFDMSSNSDSIRFLKLELAVLGLQNWLN